MTDIHEEMPLEELAGFVCEGLSRHGIDAVLTGGAVVSIHSRNAYMSYDLDFIIEGIAKRVDAPMTEMGFAKKADGRHWVHPRTKFWVEFPAGPLEVGDAPVTAIEERSTPSGLLRLLPPTECVMDRLAAYYHWRDLQSLEQAIAVATRNPIDLERIRRWSDREACTAGFVEFKAALEKARRHRPSRPGRDES